MNNELLDLWVDAFMQCLAGLPLTLSLTFSSLLIGGLMALPMSILHARKTTMPARIIRVFAFFFTGTPLLVQLYLFYDGVGGLSVVQSLMDILGFGFLL